ncbi:MAG: ATP-binding protein [bacterium]|jgi:serine/threonine-protein kinase RsbW|nr:ATP-binding protein [bacterium]
MERSLCIPSDPAAIDLVEAFLSAIASDLGLTDDQAGDLIIAGTEAANNAILHGNQQRRDLSVRLHARVAPCRQGRYLELSVSDEGHGLPDTPQADPTEPEHLLDISGRGLLIIRHLMDEVRVETSERGMRIVLVKTIT